MTPRKPPTLPVDPLLEIIARADDVATVIRSAACSKSLRGAILDPGFHKRLALRAAANGGFDPGLLAGVSYRLCVHGFRVDPVLVQPSCLRLDLDTNLLRSSEAESSRDGLVVLRRRHNSEIRLRVYNTITGDVTLLPRMNQRLTIQYKYRSALLSVNGAGSSFELLVMYKKINEHLETQTFSSQNAKWSTARQIHLPPGVHFEEASWPSAPAVIGRSVHWFCRSTRPAPAFPDGDLMVLALHVESAQATVINLPQELFASMERSHIEAASPEKSLEKGLILAATAQGTKLSIIVAEKIAISTWTLLQEEGGGISWSRQAVIRRREIARQLPSDHALDAYQPVQFSVFGERSGTVVFWIRRVGLFQLNLGTKKVLLLWRGTICDFDYNAQAFLHEINLVSVLQCMKLF